MIIYAWCSLRNNIEQIIKEIYAHSGTIYIGPNLKKTTYTFHNAPYICNCNSNDSQRAPHCGKAQYMILLWIFGGTRLVQLPSWDTCKYTWKFTVHSCSSDRSTSFWDSWQELIKRTAQRRWIILGMSSYDLPTNKWQEVCKHVFCYKMHYTFISFHVLVEEVPMKFYCILRATGNIRMEVTQKIKMYTFLVALAYNGISIIIFLKAPGSIR